ncbi:Tex family protein [Solidesulfovibrio magneticus]|uniref:Transcription accessory protein n=1 Tax=Solidesulfovibrio magneticus (strain ATCC 700980 / DSM 13731 / RS-1) TaxID=573370 RepID=C4XRK3_SOLM1|nr:Tex family protein [Solidesulfovibrio magneticus]BAH75548.1 transcription accessory protein [Solidesulfovibrio magneticus RS-1]
MTEKHAALIAKELSVAPRQVAAVAGLLADGATIPFIARYRKEATGSLDEVVVAAVRDRLQQLADLDKRRAAILESLTERDLLTDALARDIEAAQDMARLEDLYLPHRPKRRTRAAMARERGLEPLAELLMRQRGVPPEKEAARFVNPEKDVADVAAALAGARDIMAEAISEDAANRAVLRDLFAKRGRIVSRLVKGKEADAANYRDFFERDEAVRAVAGHRALAMFRGEREGLLALSLRPVEDEALRQLTRLVVTGRGKDSEQVAEAAADAYKRLLGPSLENELRASLKDRADREAIAIFAANLRQVLLAAPLGQARVLALDPGFRTGAKLAVLDAQGNLLHYETIFPTGSERQRDQAAETLRQLCAAQAIEAIAVGNGTAGRETERFVADLGLGVPVILVNEAGASIYSASETARNEFPDLDLTVRGAVSIGRRLMDPLAELVKIDPKSIGVGQYQHDVDQAALRKALDEVVSSCVNAVGVDLNTASVELLTAVSGLGPSLAANIVAHRKENGPFRSRAELRKVKRLGPKAFEQAAGFLRLRGGPPLDATAVHPERYALVGRMAKDLGCAVTDLIAKASLREGIEPARYVAGDVGLETLRDILAELAKPGRDPRPTFSAFAFAEGVSELADLRPGMRLPGRVTNVTAFGAFVDVGVHRDGLVHVSHLADAYVVDPAKVVAAGQEVMVTVLAIDKERGRLSLSMKSEPQATTG